MPWNDERNEISLDTPQFLSFRLSVHHHHHHHHQTKKESSNAKNNNNDNNILHPAHLNSLQRFPSAVSQAFYCSIFTIVGHKGRSTPIGILWSVTKLMVRKYFYLSNDKRPSIYLWRICANESISHDTHTHAHTSFSPHFSFCQFSRMKGIEYVCEV